MIVSSAGPIILVTNDDGINAPGIKVLAEALSPLGEVWVVAPEKTQNAVGRSMTLHKPLRLRPLKKRWYAVNGTPADCVTLAVCHLLPACLPKLVVSGINNGWNLGDDVTNSGTVAGAIEGMLHGIPSIAISLEDLPKCQYAVAGHFAFLVGKRVLECGLPEETILNVNVPSRRLENIAGIQITCLSQRRYLNPVVEKTDPRGNRYFWIAGQRESWARGKHSDHDAVSNQMVSISPLHLDLTDYSAMQELKGWEKSLFPSKQSLRKPIKSSGKGKRSPVKPKRL
ncbi:5'/3'-nucleotidase SurE [Candidatus Nitrospira neomarina]|uniref:5'-nucleotidase SurE n=1 Tax=Candidatus Nitrospira neomarina TaxID=3020899 RepID=A0AA96JZ72_9BACT|nr:5'/3'-nucleotidase SurE [Candidatus Nitrospira neomarina]WNM60826.1 5'/3'-nucleotidase SurE [Candidatus Nitrospira neomarina]